MMSLATDWLLRNKHAKMLSFWSAR